MDLRLLKQLAFSSIEYSALEKGSPEKDDCRDLLRIQWDVYMQAVARSEQQDNGAGKTLGGFYSLLLPALLIIGANVLQHAFLLFEIISALILHGKIYCN